MRRWGWSGWCSRDSARSRSPARWPPPPSPPAGRLHHRQHHRPSRRNPYRSYCRRGGAVEGRSTAWDRTCKLQHWKSTACQPLPTFGRTLTLVSDCHLGNTTIQLEFYFTTSSHLKHPGSYCPEQHELRTPGSRCRGSGSQPRRSSPLLRGTGCRPQGRGSGRWGLAAEARCK